MEQLLLHLIGDFILQNDYVATNKKNKGLLGLCICICHGFLYTVPFVIFLDLSITCALVICVTHVIIDRTIITTRFLAWRNSTSLTNFGFSDERPAHLTLWLNIITDNTFHLIINFLAIRYL